MYEMRALVLLCAFQTPGKERRRWPWVKAKASSVAVNTQLDAALINSQALGKLINKANKVDQLNREI